MEQDQFAHVVIRLAQIESAIEYLLRDAPEHRAGVVAVLDKMRAGLLEAHGITTPPECLLTKLNGEAELAAQRLQQRPLQ